VPCALGFAAADAIDGQSGLQTLPLLHCTTCHLEALLQHASFWEEKPSLMTGSEMQQTVHYTNNDTLSATMSLSARRTDHWPLDTNYLTAAVVVGRCQFRFSYSTNLGAFVPHFRFARRRFRETS
jgi:hypothetical protein